MPNTEKIVWSRVDGVINLILENPRYLQGKRQVELSEMVAKQFDVSIRTAQRYIKEAKTDLKKMTSNETQNALQRALMDRELLILKSKGVWDDKKKKIHSGTRSLVAP